MTEVDEFLEHYGVKGQKWGIITKFFGSDKNNPTRKKAVRKPRKTSADYKQAQTYRKKHPSELTNQQLKKYNERVNLEQNYRRLNENKIKKGENKTKEIIGIAGTASAVYTIYKSPLGKAAVQAGKLALYKRI